MQKIKFNFHPRANNTVEKDENGKKRRYLYGVTSGIKTDLHGERMTENCIKSMMDQAQAGEILLYPDVHGVRATDDIGRLVEATILENGDWETGYRLYDASDDVGPVTQERADKMWRQSCGLPPYEKPIQKGFSIEGYIPDDGIIEMSSDGRRVIDKVQLDGVVVVPRPAYGDSIASAIYKALNGGENYLRTKKGIESHIQQKLQSQELRDEYYSKRYNMIEALDEMIEEVMTGDIIDKAERLNVIFDEFKMVMVPLIINSAGVFEPRENDDESTAAFDVYAQPILN